MLSCIMPVSSTEISAEFASLGIDLSMCRELELKTGIKNCVPVQEKVISPILSRKNLIFTSETGTGKTFAYLLPLLSNILQKINSEPAVKSNIRLLVIAPTFELASQIKKNMTLIAPNIKNALLIGSAPLKRQMEALKEKPVCAAGTPARVLELIRLKKLKLASDCALVLDEVDRLFSPETRDTVRDLVAFCNSAENKNAQIIDTQIIACSATINASTKKILTDLVADTEFVQMPLQDVLQNNIEHQAIFSDSRTKLDILRKYLTAAMPKKALIFTSRLSDVEKIASFLQEKKYACAALHSKTEKIARKNALEGFISGKYKILVTSDLASRGLDIDNISHVIQFDLPEDADFFVHRAGRTGRLNSATQSFNKSGINVVIGDAREMRFYSQLEKKLGIKVFPKELRNGKIEAPG